MFGDEADMYQLEDVQLHDLGVVGEVTITKDDTLLMKVNLKLIRNIASYNTKFTKLPLKLSNVQISSNKQSLPHLNGHKTIGGGGGAPHKSGFGQKRLLCMLLMTISRTSSIMAGKDSKWPIYCDF